MFTLILLFCVAKKVPEHGQKIVLFFPALRLSDCESWVNGKGKGTNLINIWHMFNVETDAIMAKPYILKKFDFNEFVANALRDGIGSK